MHIAHVQQHSAHVQFSRRMRKCYFSLKVPVLFTDEALLTETS